MFRQMDHLQTPKVFSMTMKEMVLQEMERATLEENWIERDLMNGTTEKRLGEEGNSREEGEE